MRSVFHQMFHIPCWGGAIDGDIDACCARDDAVITDCDTLVFDAAAEDDVDFAPDL